MDLAAMGKSVLDAGGIIVEILAGGNTGGQPTLAELNAWITTYGLTVTTVKDPDSMPQASLTALQVREYTYVVDLSNMKILNFFPGTQSGIGTTGAMSGMQTMLQLLGPTGG
jgi:hypothetical protein